MTQLIKAGLVLALLSTPISIVHAQDKGSKAYLVSNAHLDSQWNWDVQTTISQYIPKTLFRNLTLIDKYPDYVFNCEAGIKYAWMKEYYPEEFERLREAVKAGRWHISGSSWEASDANVPSPESLTRNILLGQHFYQEEFGTIGTDIFLPDCFGFGLHLPAIAAHCGLIGFSTQKLQWRGRNLPGTDSKVPFQFGLWRALDGNRIMVAANALSYGTRFHSEDLTNSSELAEHAALNPYQISYHYYGTGDTGGSPTIESVATVQAAIDRQRAGKGGSIQVVSASSDQLFKDFLPYSAHPELPVWDKELTMDVHGTGCYTSQAAMKRFNRLNEQLADAAERSAAAADWLGRVPYPQARLNEAWRRFLWHQFHDDLTGTSIPRAYEFSWNDEMISLRQFSDVVETSVGAVASRMDTRVSGTPLVLYNPSGTPRREIVTVEAADGRVFDSRGRAVRTQRLSDGKLAFVAEVPSVGYAVYDLRKGNASTGKSNLKTGLSSIENAIYSLRLDSNGDICSLIDKRSGRQLVAEGKAIRLALFTENESFQWPAWEILKKTVDGTPVAVDGDVRISVAENGPVLAALKVERRWGDSHFTQYIRLSDGADEERIDIVNEVDWHGSNALLKAEFPLTVSNPVARYDIGTGSIERPNNMPEQYEVYAQQWADLTEPDGTYGVAILNDCKYGWDKPADNVLRLTLLHTPKTRRSYAYQNRQDHGLHRFTYSIVAHEGDWRKGGVAARAEALNQPVKAFTVPRHAGSLGRTFSFAEVVGEGVALRALKKAEDGSGYVVRFYELQGREARNVSVRFPSPVVSASELNGNEAPLGPATAAGNELRFDIGPWGIKTFLVRLDPKAPDTVKQVPLELPYGLYAATFNAFRADGNIDGAGHSYAAELLPASLVQKGVRFHLQNPAGPVAVRAGGQEIALPEGNWNRVYLLAASAKGDTRTRFLAGGNAIDVTVPDYSGFVAQWGHTGHTEGFVKEAEYAYVGTHRHGARENQDLPYEFTYLFNIVLDVPAGARSITLPVNRKVMVFAATAVADDVNTALPVSDLIRFDLPASPEPELEIGQASLLSGAKLSDSSGRTNNNEAPAFAVDDNPETKWCDNSAKPEKFIEFDLGEVKTLTRWSVLHAASESQSYVTKAFALKVRNSADEPWRTADEVSRNSENETDRRLPEPVQARFVRLSISQGDQVDTNISRIYEFGVY
jgi:alpha-mannosidase